MSHFPKKAEFKRKRCAHFANFCSSSINGKEARAVAPVASVLTVPGRRSCLVFDFLCFYAALRGGGITILRS